MGRDLVQQFTLLFRKRFLKAPRPQLPQQVPPEQQPLNHTRKGSRSFHCSSVWSPRALETHTAGTPRRAPVPLAPEERGLKDRPGRAGGPGETSPTHPLHLTQKRKPRLPVLRRANSFTTCLDAFTSCSYLSSCSYYFYFNSWHFFA